MSYTCKAQFRLKCAPDTWYVLVCARAYVSDVGWVEWIQERSSCYRPGGLFHPAKTAAA